MCGLPASPACRLPEACSSLTIIESLASAFASPQVFCSPQSNSKSSGVGVETPRHSRVFDKETHRDCTMAANMKPEEIAPMVTKLRSTWLAGKTRDASWRKAQLKALHRMLIENHGRVR